MLGNVFHRGSPGYEAARRATMWNARVPDRFPDVVVQAADVHDVVAAVRLARTNRWRVGVCSGGHSWSGNHVRDGGLLLDVSRLDEVHIDAQARRAIVGPGRSGHTINPLLKRHGLFFPAGHCQGVALGGYLLQGGFGWHGRALGPACASVEGIDCVTADGELVHASADENADLYWAARGAGAGFFAVVTRFHLRLHPRPRVIGFALQRFRPDALDDLFGWAHEVAPRVPSAIELQILMTRRHMDLVAPVFSDSLRDALDSLRFMNESPLRKRARPSFKFVPSGLRLMYRGVMAHYPEQHRYAVDNMWTRAGASELLPGLREIARTMPPAPTHLLWMNWAPPPDRPDMAFSMEDKTYLALYAVWKDARDDAQYALWPTERIRAMAHLSSGCQLADENLGLHPQRFCSVGNLQRLDELRARRDPDGRFHPWMGRP